MTKLFDPVFNRPPAASRAKPAQKDGRHAETAAPRKVPSKGKMVKCLAADDTEIMVDLNNRVVEPVFMDNGDA
jgi:hypothetical protein